MSNGLVLLRATSHYPSQYWPRSMSPYDVTRAHWVNSSPSSGAYMCLWIGSALVQIIAWRLFGAKPLSKSMLGYCELDPYEQTSVNFQSKYKTFHSRKRILKIVCEMAAILSRGRWVNALELRDMTTTKPCITKECAWHGTHGMLIWGTVTHICVSELREH